MACRVAITTSRGPSKITLELVNDFVNSLPGTAKVVRGKKSFTALLEEAVSCGARYIAFIWDRRGMPSALLFYDVGLGAWKPYMLLISGARPRLGGEASKAWPRRRDRVPLSSMWKRRATSV